VHGFGLGKEEGIEHFHELDGHLLLILLRIKKNLIKDLSEFFHSCIGVHGLELGALRVFGELQVSEFHIQLRNLLGFI
jgi:hypothetical protein